MSTARDGNERLTGATDEFSPVPPGRLGRRVANPQASLLHLGKSALTKGRKILTCNNANMGIWTFNDLKAWGVDERTVL